MGILLEKMQKQNGSDLSDSPKASCEAISTFRKNSEKTQKGTEPELKSENLRYAQTLKAKCHKAFGESENLSVGNVELEHTTPLALANYESNQSKLVSFAAQHCIDEHGLSIHAETIAALVPPSDWNDTEQCTPEELQAWASALALRAIRYQGQVPNGWDKVANCQNCGPVYSFAGGDYLACPWCEMTRAGKSIPLPEPDNT
jgi:hypothetical protein